jgi:hypothetical protein
VVSEGHRTEDGGFDHDAFESHFLLGFMSQYLAELDMPLIGACANKAQINDLPESLRIFEELGKEVKS